MGAAEVPEQSEVAKTAPCRLEMGELEGEMTNAQGPSGGNDGKNGGGGGNVGEQVYGPEGSHFAARRSMRQARTNSQTGATNVCLL